MSLQDLLAIRERITNELVITNRLSDQGDQEALSRVSGLQVAVSIFDEEVQRRYPEIWGPPGDTAQEASPAEGVVVPRHWTEFTPAQALEQQLVLPRADIRGPLNEEGQPCPWPWEPQQRTGASIGQYHCTYCGAMVMAGLPHIEYSDDAPPVS